MRSPLKLADCIISNYPNCRLHVHINLKFLENSYIQPFEFTNNLMDHAFTKTIIPIYSKLNRRIEEVQKHVDERQTGKSIAAQGDRTFYFTKHEMSAAHKSNLTEVVVEPDKAAEDVNGSIRKHDDGKEHREIPEKATTEIVRFSTTCHVSHLSSSCDTNSSEDDSVVWESEGDERAADSPQLQKSVHQINDDMRGVDETTSIASHVNSSHLYNSEDDSVMWESVNDELVIDNPRLQKEVEHQISAPPTGADYFEVVQSEVTMERKNSRALAAVGSMDKGLHQFSPPRSMCVEGDVVDDEVLSSNISPHAQNNWPSSLNVPLQSKEIYEEISAQSGQRNNIEIVGTPDINNSPGNCTTQSESQHNFTDLGSHTSAFVTAEGSKTSRMVRSANEMTGEGGSSENSKSSELAAELKQEHSLEINQDVDLVEVENGNCQTHSSEVVRTRSHMVGVEITASKSEIPVVANENNVKKVDIDKYIDEKLEGLREEENHAKISRARASRDTETITGEMKSEMLEMLEIFQLPYIIAPFEAEAQCAVLEQV